MPKLDEAVEVQTEATEETTPVGTNGSQKPTKKPTGGGGKKPTKSQKAEVKYPDVVVEPCVFEQALTVERAKDLIGWVESEEKPGSLFKDALGNYVRCTYNTKNRPFEQKWAEDLAQAILNSGPGLPEAKRAWQFNGETITFGKSGQCMSGQHRLIGLCLAGQLWEKDPAKYGKIWPSEPTLETILVFGLEETPEVMRTIDNVKSRTLADVVYTSDTFGRMKASDRKNAVKLVEYAVKLLSYRTGLVKDAYHPRMPARGYEFLQRHKKLVNSVSHILDETGDKENRDKLRSYSAPGTAAGLHYLMSVSGTVEAKAAKYAEDPKESLLSFENQDKADEFWTLLISGNAAMKGVKEAFASLIGVHGDRAPSVAEKQAVLVQAFNEFVDGKDPQKKRIMPDWRTTDGGEKVLDSVPVLSGIDIGGPKEEEEPEEVEAETPAAEEEVEAEDAEMSALDTLEVDSPPQFGDPLPDEIWNDNLEKVRQQREVDEAVRKAEKARRRKERNELKKRLAAQNLTWETEEGSDEAE